MIYRENYRRKGMTLVWGRKTKCKVTTLIVTSSMWRDLKTIHISMEKRSLHASRDKPAFCCTPVAWVLRYYVYVLCIALCFLFAMSVSAQTKALQGKVICIDPGHGDTADSDVYRVGPTGEREEWINLRVGLYLKKLLEDAGAQVVMTRTEDVFVVLKDRAQLALDHQADLFLSIHHNATADTSVSFPVIYFHGHAQENRASVDMARYMAKSLLHKLYEPRQNSTPVSIVSDYTIFPQAGAAVLRHSYGIPALIVEASFFSNPAEERRLKDTTYNIEEAHAYLEAIHSFFSKPIDVIYPKYSIQSALMPLNVLQEADRMDGEAKRWKRYYREAERIIGDQDRSRYAAALDLLKSSIIGFPDSYLAATCLELSKKIYLEVGDAVMAEDFAKRRAAYYVNY